MLLLGPTEDVGKLALALGAVFFAHLFRCPCGVTFQTGSMNSPLCMLVGHTSTHLHRNATFPFSTHLLSLISESANETEGGTEGVRGGVCHA